jgi:hypothetical protein
MKTFHCPHCGQAHFATLCSDCQAEAIRIQETRSVFHFGRCHICGHVDDEPCSARVGSSEMMTHAWRNRGNALKGLAQKAAGLAARAADAIKGNSARVR